MTIDSISFNDIPTELLELIFIQSTIDLTPSSRDRYYSNFSLVSSNFRSTAQRLLFNRLTILDGSKIRTVIDGIQNNLNLGKLIQHLKVVFMSGSDNSDSLTTLPTPKVIYEFDLISREAFFTLIELLPNIINLTMELPTFIKTNLRTGILDIIEFRKTTVETLFPNLSSLNLITASFDLNQELLRDLLIMSPNLSHLYLGHTRKSNTRSNFSAPPPPAIICPKLKSLKVEGPFYNRILFNPESEDSFIPISAYSNLKKLDIPGGVDLDRLEPMVLIAGPSIESLTFQFPTNYSEFSPLLPHFTSLVTLSITFHDIPIDFLSKIPTSIKVLNMKLTLPVLQFLKSHPRPLLQLESIGIAQDTIRHPTPWIVFDLPQSVKNVIYFGSDLTVERALKEGYIREHGSLKVLDMPTCRFWKEIEVGVKKVGIEFTRKGFGL